MASLEQEVETIKRAITKIARSLDPDEDWVPVLLTASEEGRGLIPLAHFFEDDLGKEMVAQAIIPTVVEELSPWLVGLVTTAWMTRVELDDSPFSARRMEIVNLVVFTKDQEQMHVAEIIRHEGSHPELKPWELHAGATVGGRFGDALREAMQE